MDPGPIKARKRAWPSRAALVLAVLALATVVALAIAERHAQQLLLRAFTARTGRTIRVDGEFALQLLRRRPTLTASDVTIGNPPWMDPGIVARVATLSLDLEWQLSPRILGIRRLEARGAVLNLVREADGRANWHMNPEGPGKGPPLMKSLDVPDARVELHDNRRHLQFSGRVSARDRSQGAGPAALRIEAAGKLNGRDASFSIDGEPLATARIDRPYHFSLQERSGAMRLRGQGALAHPFDMRVLQGTFEITGPDMSDAYFLVGLHLPETGAFRLTGHFERQMKRFLYQDLALTSGGSDLGGSLTVDSTSGRAKIESELSSHVLRLADLGKAAAGREPSAPPASAPQASATPLPLAALQRSDWRVTFRAHELQIGAQALQAVTASISLQHGVLRVDHLGARLAGGELSGDARLDAGAKPPQATLELRAQDLQLAQITHADPPPLSGALSGRVKLSGEGKSVHELLATANGTAAALIPDGTLRESTAELASLDLNGALGALLKSREQTPIRCGVASFTVQDGTATARSLLLDTDKVLITGSGEVQMDSQTLDLTLHGHPKSPRLALRSAVLIQGTLRRPQFRLSGQGTAAQAGIAAALGMVLTPLAAIVAFINPGRAHDADCKELLRQAAASSGAAGQDLAQTK